MNEKEIGELRRRLTSERCTSPAVYGCYVSKEHEMIATFRRSFSLAEEEENEKYFSVFKKTMSGSIGRSLINLEFDTEEVLHGEKHATLTSLRNSELKNEEEVKAFLQKIADTVTMDENFAVLLMCNTYDVPHHHKDGTVGDSDEVFTYLICAVCPVKMSHAALCYHTADKNFQSRDLGWVLSAPEFGFTFPAFDDRTANIYGALYYTRDAGNMHEEFVNALFHTTKLPMPAADQTATFDEVLAESLDTACNLKVIRAVHKGLSERIKEHKEQNEHDPLVIGKSEVREIIASVGVEEEKLDTFVKNFSDSFGAATDLPPQNIMNPKRFSVETPDVVIKVNPERSDLIETRVIDGVKYILIRADDGAEVNGINIQF